MTKPGAKPAKTRHPHPAGRVGEFIQATVPATLSRSLRWERVNKESAHMPFAIRGEGFRGEVNNHEKIFIHPRTLNDETVRETGKTRHPHPAGRVNGIVLQWWRHHMRMLPSPRRL